MVDRRLGGVKRGNKRSQTAQQEGGRSLETVRLRVLSGEAPGGVRDNRFARYAHGNLRESLPATHDTRGTQAILPIGKSAGESLLLPGPPRGSLSASPKAQLPALEAKILLDARLEPRNLSAQSALGPLDS
jgi:hypothetical protein